MTPAWSACHTKALIRTFLWCQTSPPAEKRLCMSVNVLTWACVLHAHGYSAFRLKRSARRRRCSPGSWPMPPNALGFRSVRRFVGRSALR